MRPSIPLGLALVGVAVLNAAAAWLAPAAVAVADVPDHEGARVAVEGWVVRVHQGARGAALDVSDGRARLPVLVSGDAHAHEGDRVRAVGVVTRDGGGVLLSAEAVEVVRATGARGVGGALADLPDGLVVTLRGVHARGMLRDGDAAIPLAFQDEPAPEGALTVRGVLDLDRGAAAYRLKVVTWTSP